MSDEQSGTKYEIIRQKFCEREKATREFVRENNRFAALVANGLQNFLGMPKYYEAKRDGTTTYHRYVPLYRVRSDGTISDEDAFNDAVVSCSDGTFEFGLGIVLEPAPNAFPKQIVQAKVECVRASGNVEVRISGETVICRFDGSASTDIHLVHELLYRLLNNYLDSRWGDPDARRAFGFQLV
ncbi:hypothetical protein GQF56_24510 [Rhodobacter sphaeroides]|jgi:hypothetical protein|uniref:hypothetical protein n=1 Tax=Cereibacter sphaeroides TaxID=1063 RepID=UPI00036095F7|nr:hypothetical protein [Cereibacter sphaeroides]AMJ49839.1 hypothetical protein APX01_19995 [Cereibacter sphaeroides]AMJ50167.1 hypothetical protein APX01_21685 [Cereibacter sphaeroides]ANS36470.1 hypothetical protein A3858_19550 [Cereibacter sphaeroides]ATN65616.1 hypothetical protein A3857_20030 [Cereibacter sphaeroides]AXC64093.1 hypothetical protein DQL45_22185 [Cereibacter sphaeroides 2.4.1]